MSADSIPTGQGSKSWHRVCAGTCFGASAATAVVANAAPIVESTVRSPNDFTLPGPTDTAMGMYGIAIGVCVLVVVGSWLLTRFLTVRGATAILAAWTGWNLLELYRSRNPLPHVDSNGAAATAVLAAVAAVVLAMATIAFARDVSGRAALCAFLIVAVTSTALTYSAVRNFRAGAGNPALTVAASIPLVPGTIGPAEYRIRLSNDAKH